MKSWFILLTGCFSITSNKIGQQKTPASPEEKPGLFHTGCAVTECMALKLCECLISKLL